MNQPTRTKSLNDLPPREGATYVLYWMGLSQRARFNPALEYAVEEARKLRLTVLVCYGTAESFAEVNARHWAFLLEDMAEVGPEVRKRGIAYVTRRQPPVETPLLNAADAALAVCDRNHLKPVRRFYADFAARAPCTVAEMAGVHQGLGR
ncbi:deoxyribodipyrimidine photo-lyase [Methylorubrum rhodesianum]|jgi:deoxyribodipyrimidine photo-lyase|uniref:deoxyribodipyrimidine photo-lyase n=1 Tax=Methylorubrum rhodesianum TaxID=29427 RepID=UPI0037472ADB